MEIKKYDKIFQLGNKENEEIFLNPDTEVCIQEKVDGANFRIYFHEGKVLFGSRTQQLTSDEGEDTNLEKNFKRAVEFVREKLKDKDLNKYNGMTLFAENMVKHTIDYNWEITPPIIGFDVYQEDYWHWDKAKALFEELGFDFVPIVKVCKASEIKEVTDEMVPVSKYTVQQAEGIVFKTFNPRIYAKYVRAEFKEKNKETFGGSKKHATNDEEYLTAMYCTNYRIEKGILKLLDEGKELHMSMMKFLPNLVYDDLWEENYKEIIHLKQKTICFDTLRKQVTKRCLNVLTQFITNNALNKGKRE